MKHRFEIVIILFFSVFVLFPSMGFPEEMQGIDSTYQRANKLYDQKKYAKAREIYEEICRRGDPPVAALYNLGNSCARMGDTGAAVLYYTRASRVAPRDSDIRGNLVRVEPQINRSDIFFLLKPLAWIKNRLSLDEWSVLASIFLFLAGVCMGLHFLFRREGPTRIFRRMGILFIACLVLSGTFLSLKAYGEIVIETAVVMKPDTLSRSGPGDQFEEIHKLPAGTKVRVISSPQNGWVRIRLMDGRSAYLPLTSLRNVSDS